MGALRAIAYSASRLIEPLEVRFVVEHGGESHHSSGRKGWAMNSVTFDNSFLFHPWFSWLATR